MIGPSRYYHEIVDAKGRIWVMIDNYPCGSWYSPTHRFVDDVNN